MTPKQKKAHLAALTAMIQGLGFEKDAWNNWKRIFKDDIYRIKVKQINIRIEIKYSGTRIWRKIVSKPIVNFSLTEMAIFLNRFV